jgi:hypothetical protein
MGLNSAQNIAAILQKSTNSGKLLKKRVQGSDI